MSIHGRRLRLPGQVLAVAVVHIQPEMGGHFQDFLKRFTGSRYSADVQQRMIYLQQQLAESEINIARYNTERKAYVAAAQRARWVLEYYPLSPQVPEALATLAYSYQQLNRPELAEPYLKLIQLNYPQLLKD